MNVFEVLSHDNRTSDCCSAKQMGPFGAQSPPADPPQGCSHRGSGTPRGLGASEREKLKPAMDAVHGHALGAAALLVASTR